MSDSNADKPDSPSDGSAPEPGSPAPGPESSAPEPETPAPEPETPAPEPETPAPIGAPETLAEAADLQRQSAEDHHTPGTVALTFIFLICFAVYYFANWKALADVWHVR